MSFLEARNISKVYRSGSGAVVRAIDGVWLSIPRGSLAALTGPSGSGKTTLLTLLGGLDRPTHGQVLFDGRDLSTFSDAALARTRRRVGFVFQDFALIANLPVWENVTYPLIPRGVPAGRRRELAGSLLARLGIPDKMLARPRELSGGELQRVAVARAIAGEPEILFADEPTSNLDAGSAGAVLAVLRDIHAAGKTVVVASHDPQITAIATETHEFQAGRRVGGVGAVPGGDGRTSEPR
jgi:putative ABC transport system ATP-binding protein